MTCHHVYENIGAAKCPACGGDTHELDWDAENAYARQWRVDNPDAGYGGWWSI